MSASERGRGRPRTQDHGSAACYKRGCRCYECQKAWTRYLSDRRIAKRRAAEAAAAEEARVLAWLERRKNPVPEPVWDRTAFD